MREPSKFTVQRSIIVDVSQTLLWDLLNDDDRVFDLNPYLVGHRVTKVHEGGGHDCVQEYEFKGRRMTQTCHLLRFERPSFMVMEATGESGRTLVTATLDDLGATSRLTYLHEHALAQWVDPLGRAITRHLHGRRVRAALRRVKSVAERP